MELVYSDRNLYSPARSCAFNRPEHHRQAVDIVGTPCFGGNSVGDVPQKLVHHAKVPSSLLGDPALRSGQNPRTHKRILPLS